MKKVMSEQKNLIIGIEPETLGRIDSLFRTSVYRSMFLRKSLNHHLDRCERRRRKVVGNVEQTLLSFIGDNLLIRIERQILTGDSPNKMPIIGIDFLWNAIENDDEFLDFLKYRSDPEKFDTVKRFRLKMPDKRIPVPMTLRKRFNLCAEGYWQYNLQVLGGGYDVRGLDEKLEKFIGGYREEEIPEIRKLMSRTHDLRVKESNGKAIPFRTLGEGVLYEEQLRKAYLEFLKAHRIEETVAHDIEVILGEIVSNEEISTRVAGVLDNGLVEYILEMTLNAEAITVIKRDILVEAAANLLRRFGEQRWDAII